MTNYCRIEIVDFNWVLAPVEINYDDDKFTSAATFGGEFIIESNNSRPYY